MLDKPEHFATAKQAEQRAQGLAPQMFPQSVCIVHRPDADGKWHVCTRGEAEGKYRDALHVTYISNDGDIKPEAAEQQFTVTENEHRRRRPSRGRRPGSPTRNQLGPRRRCRT